MLAGVYAVKLSVVNRHIVHVAGAGHKLHPLKDLPGPCVILEKARRITRISRNVRLLKTTHLPQIASLSVYLHAVESLAPNRHAGSLKHILNCPGLWIHADDASQPVGINPEFAVLPSQPMTGAAIIRRPEWNLEMINLLGVHVRLENAFRW